MGKYSLLSASNVKKPVFMYIFYIVFLRKMVSDYQKSKKYYKSMLDTFCNSFQTLILKKRMIRLIL